MAHCRKECITVFATTQCTLKCSYCYLRDCPRPTETIELAFVSRGIEDFFGSSRSRHVRIFAAGEPTCAFDLIRAVRDYAYHLAHDNLVLEVQTNGVFSSEIADWLGKNAQIVWISCDGPPDVQDVLRPLGDGGRSSTIIERNIPILRSFKNDILVGIRSTITPMNVCRQTEMLEYFARLGVMAVYSDPVFPPVTTDGVQIRVNRPSSDFNMVYACEYLKAQSRAKELGMFYGSILTVNFDEKTDTFCRACHPYPHLTTDGFVTCCDMAFSGTALPLLVYGKFNRRTQLIDYDHARIAEIRLRRASNLVSCKGCEVLLHCAGGCFGEGVNETGEILGVKKDYCEAIRFLGTHLPLDSGLYPYLHP